MFALASSPEEFRRCPLPLLQKTLIRRRQLGTDPTQKRQGRLLLIVPARSLDEAQTEHEFVLEWMCADIATLIQGSVCPPDIVVHGLRLYECTQSVPLPNNLHILRPEPSRRIRHGHPLRPRIIKGDPRPRKNLDHPANTIPHEFRGRHHPRRLNFYDDIRRLALLVLSLCLLLIQVFKPIIKPETVLRRHFAADPLHLPPLQFGPQRRGPLLIHYELRRPLHDGIETGVRRAHPLHQRRTHRESLAPDPLICPPQWRN